MSNLIFTFDTRSPAIPGMESALWGEMIDPREMLYDTADFYNGGFGGTIGAYGPAPSRLEDRLNGDYLPTYQNESDLQFINGIAHFLMASCPRSVGVQETLTNYVIGTGFDFTVQEEKGCSTTPPAGLKQFIQGVMNRFLDKNDFICNEDREIHARTIIDGEAIIGLNCDTDGIPRTVQFEPQQLTEPLDAGRIEEYVGSEYAVNFSVPTSWKYGVHTPLMQPEKPIGYHIIHDRKSEDWDYYPADRLQHIKRNVTRKAKRGISDFYCVFIDIGEEAKIRHNIAVGTAINAAIAFVREHASGVTVTQAQGMVTSQKTGDKTRWNDGIYKTLSTKRYQPGTILDVSGGMNFREGPLGSNRNPNFMLPAEYALRCIGTRWQMPEYMISGDASNGNYASTLVAESPFVKAREADQEFYKNHFLSLIWKALRLSYRAGLFDRFGVTWGQITAWFDIKCQMPEVASRDPDAVSQRQDRDIKAGTLSKHTAMVEAGRDPDEELKYMEEERVKAAAVATVMNPAGVDPVTGKPVAAAPGGTAPVPGPLSQNSIKSAVQGAMESVETTAEAKAICESILREFYP